MTDRQPLSASQAADLGVALNEADLLAVEVDAEAGNAVVWLEALTLPPRGPEPTDRRRRRWLGEGSRGGWSYRYGRGDDSDPRVLPLRLARLADLIAACGRLPIYGW